MPKDMELAVLYDVYGELLTVKQRDMFAQYYESDLSLAEIAENEGISRQGVRDAVKRAEVQLLEWERVMGCVARQRTTRTALEDITRRAAEIAAATRGHGALWEVYERAGEILAACGELMADEGGAY